MSATNECDARGLRRWARGVIGGRDRNPAETAAWVERCLPALRRWPRWHECCASWGTQQYASCRIGSEPSAPERWVGAIWSALAAQAV